MTTDASPVSPWARTLVEALVSSGRLRSEDGARVLGQSAGRSEPVMTVLSDEGLVDANTVLACLAAISGLSWVDLVAAPPEPDALAVVPTAVSRQFKVLGYRLHQKKVVLACAEPLGVAELKELAHLLGTDIGGCVLADPATIMKGLSDAPTDLPAAPVEQHGIPAPPPERLDVRELRAQSIAAEPLAPSPGARPREQDPSMRGDDEDLVWVPKTGAEGSLGTAARVDSEWITGIGGGAGSGSGQAAAPSAGRPSPSPGISATGVVDRSGVPGRVPPMNLDSLLTYAVENGASDLHLSNGSSPAIRVDGAIHRIEGLAPLDNNILRQMIFGVLPQSHRERFEATKELDTAHAVPGVGRFRMSVFQQRGSIGAVLRAIPSEIPDLAELGLPKVVATFADLRRGLVLVTGPTGSGKSTTLASIVSIINHTKPLHIMTVEDPIEFLHHHGKAIVNQREVGVDTESFGECLRHVLRQDPDVILVGELRDLETISTALTAAETGHLVFATLHTQDAPQTIDRMIDVFPPTQQEQVRIQLAGALEAVVTQQLVPAAGGVGRVPVAEVMICNSGIRNLIRTGKTHQVYSLMQTGGNEGMQTMDQGLSIAVTERKITEAMAYSRSRDPKQLRDYLRG